MNETTKPQLPILRTGGSLLAIIPQSIEDAYRIATAAVRSGLVHRDMNTPERALMVIMHGMEIGLPPMASLERIAIINGRRCVWGDAVPALAMDTGELVEWDEGFTGEGDNLEAYCRIARQRGKTIFRKEARFSVTDAKQADLWDDRPKVQRRTRDGGTYEAKNDSPWFRYRKRMMQMRARVVFRDLFSDKFMGLYIAEELVGRDSDAEMRDVTPKDFRRVENPMDDKPIMPTRTLDEALSDAVHATGRATMRYWYHPESDTVWASMKDEKDSDGLVEEISKERHAELVKELMKGAAEMEVDHEAAEAAASASMPEQVDLEEAIRKASVAREQHKTVDEAIEERMEEARRGRQPPQARTEPAGEGKPEGAPNVAPKAENAPATAPGASRPGWVHLTPDEVADAEAKGISIPDYARAKQRREKGLREPGELQRQLRGEGSISERAAAARGLPAKEPARATPQQEAGADVTGRAAGRASAEPAAPAASPGDKFYQDGLTVIANAVEAGALNGWWRSTRKERIAAGMTADQLDNLTQQYNRKFIALTGA